MTFSYRVPNILAENGQIKSKKHSIWILGGAAFVRDDPLVTGGSGGAMDNVLARKRSASTKRKAFIYELVVKIKIVLIDADIVS
jgi:hypothetical protein